MSLRNSECLGFSATIIGAKVFMTAASPLVNTFSVSNTFLPNYLGGLGCNSISEFLIGAGKSFLENAFSNIRHILTVENEVTNHKLITSKDGS